MSLQNEIQKLREKIDEELQLIEEFNEQISDLEDECYDYENDYDYESDPNGDDYDMMYINSLREDIRNYESRVVSSQRMIQYYEEEISKLELSSSPTLKSLIRKWETQLNSYHQFVESVRKDYGNGEYSSDNDYQNDLGKGYGMVSVTTSFLDDLKELVTTEGNTLPKFESIEDAYDYYWDLSRNPYDMYETERSLIEGERDFVKGCGYDWDEWCSINKNPING
jgi:DNA repair exonuclease SbcCD ATPase subunit